MDDDDLYINLSGERSKHGVGGHAYDAADAEWPSATISDGTFISLTVYDDRDLTRWEWIKVRVLRRRDPRLLAVIKGEK